jgi:hypothetical protein
MGWEGAVSEGCCSFGSTGMSRVTTIAKEPATFLLQTWVATGAFVVRVSQLFKISCNSEILYKYPDF